MSDNANAICMPKGLVDRADDLSNCPTTKSLITSIALFNLEVAALSLFVGTCHISHFLGPLPLPYPAFP